MTVVLFLGGGSEHEVPSASLAHREELSIYLSWSGVPCEISRAKGVLLLKTKVCILQIETVSIPDPDHTGLKAPFAHLV